MKVKELVIKILFFTCVLFAPLTALVDLSIGIFISPTLLLGLGATFVILIIDFTISAFIIILRDNPPKILEKPNLFYYSCCFFSLLSVLLKVVVSIVNLSKVILWNTTIYSIIVILAFSIAISACILYLKIKNMALKIAIYFLIIGAFYYLITVTIGGLNEGNNLILILSAYVVLFALVTIISSIILHKKKLKELENKPYKKQF